MRFTSTAPITAHAGRAFDTLAAPGGLARLLPDAGGDRADGGGDAGPDDARAAVVCIGNLTAHYRLGITALGADPATRTVRARIRGRERDSLGDIAGVVALSVTAGPGSAAALQVSADLDIRGQVARFGSGPWQQVLDRVTARAAAGLSAADATVAPTRTETPADTRAEAPADTRAEAPAETRPAPPRRSRTFALAGIAATVTAAAVLGARAAVRSRRHSHRRAGDGDAPRHD